MPKPTAVRPHGSAAFGAARPYANVPRYDYFAALAAGRRAARRGDYTDADKWLKLAERHLALEAKQVALDAARTENRMRWDEEVATRRFWAKEYESGDGLSPAEAMRETRRGLADKP
ncbi:MAG: hypothetical protein NW200_01055 [Hyphomonadaceae bacterium]|nr:hypothetical protein [Hyphomonadaceae bacterium]